MVVDHGEVDLCVKFPGFDIDLAFITTSKTMADIWMGHTTIRKEIRNGCLALEGDRPLKKNIDDWFSFSVFSDPESLRANLS